MNVKTPTFYSGLALSLPEVLYLVMVGFSGFEAKFSYLYRLMLTLVIVTPLVFSQ